MGYLEGTRNNFVNYFDLKSLNGHIVWDYTIQDLKKYEKEENKKNKIFDDNKSQKTLEGRLFTE